MDDDFGEDENEFISQKVEKIVLQVITAVVWEKYQLQSFICIYERRKSRENS